MHAVQMPCRAKNSIKTLQRTHKVFILYSHTTIIKSVYKIANIIGPRKQLLRFLVLNKYKNIFSYDDIDIILIFIKNVIRIFIKFILYIKILICMVDITGRNSVYGKKVLLILQRIFACLKANYPFHIKACNF